MVIGFELGEGAPVGVGQLDRIADAGPALFGCVDEEHAAETFARLAAERGLVVAIQQHYPMPGLRQFQRGDDSGDAGADDQNIGLATAAAHLICPSANTMPDATTGRIALD